MADLQLAELADLLAGIDDPALGTAREVGAAANAVFGLVVVPALVRKMNRGAPVGAGIILLGGIIGGILGYWQPLSITFVQGSLLLTEVMGRREAARA